MANTSEQEICQSVLDFVTEGKYPESEKVVAAEFPVSTLSKELQLLSKARAQVEVSVLILSTSPHPSPGQIAVAKQRMLLRRC